MIRFEFAFRRFKTAEGIGDWFAIGGDLLDNFKSVLPVVSSEQGGSVLVDDFKEVANEDFGHDGCSMVGRFRLSRYQSLRVVGFAKTIVGDSVGT